MTDHIVENVFSEVDSDWNETRQVLQDRLLMAAAELIAHTKAGGLEASGRGITIKVSTHDQH